ncbi:hypothetical protein GQ53DRAFT_831353 [Thozetella sp. PMI_491]|nr:hypothetical protein GQ53DRAFT_831353 [Thozetella sp. PMI_491]
MTTLSGIDILCDAVGAAATAVGSGSLVTPLFVVNDHPHAATPQSQPAKRVRLSTEASSPAGPNHVCHICKRVYERADHLTRHMRSHENARQYQCSRCPKRFNRADLLTRHETTHNRDGDGNGRAMIRRSDRAAEACLNCSASKSKCDDQKPCGRCKIKNLVCQTPTRRGSQYRTVEDGDDVPRSPSEESTMASQLDPPSSSGAILGSDPYGLADQLGDAGRGRTAGMVPNPAAAFSETPYIDEVFPPNSMLGDMSGEMMTFNPMNNYFPDMDLDLWNLNFDAFAIPQLESHGPSPQSTGTNASKPSSRTIRDPSKAHAAFKRSPWLWEPEVKDYVRRDQEGLHIDETNIGNSPALERLKANSRLKIVPATRDRLFALVLLTKKDALSRASFPSLDLLNYLLQAYFVHDDYQCDSWLHAPTFNPDGVRPELLASVISHGASFISVPAIWQFGLAMQEIVRNRLQDVFESRNANTRDLQCLQAFMLELDTAVWSGFKRKTEIAESFLQALTTMLRRGGVFSAPADSPAIVPLASDSSETLEAKWNKFITRESYKRLALHLFFHDVQSSIALQKTALASFTEFNFSLPASRDLWKAATAQAWRELYLSKRPLHEDTPMPRVSELSQRLEILDEFGDFADLDLCYAAMLHGFWGQIAAYREAVRFYIPKDAGGPGAAAAAKRNSTHRLWLKSQHQELYRDLSEFSTVIQSYQLNLANPHPAAPASATAAGSAEKLTITAELFQMALHVSLDDLQNFVGKSGEEEARRTSAYLEDAWVTTSEARHAVWHAGQVLSHARRMPPASLRDFGAMAVYFASLALWVYGLLTSNGTEEVPMGTSAGRQSGPKGLVVIDCFETRETRAFLQLDRGVPGLTLTGDPRGGVGPLSNTGMVLSIARGLLRDNFPVKSEPLPPLVESICKLLRDLESGQAGSGPSRPSRAVSEDRE